MKAKILPFFTTRVLIVSLFVLILGALLVAPASAGGNLWIIDDFEDGDAIDWIFFGGNMAGGGGGVLSDRPQAGSFYFSTGWGGEGSASVFYGGCFRNLDDGAQITPPTDPWFNVWVLNQSNATVDEYTLEITIREDLDGNGWTNGVEDSFRLDTSFTSAEFDDQWTLISAPLSSFTDLFTGGDGTFNGNLDEIVLVISGVAGGAGSVVEVDFDQFSFTSSGPVVLIDDFESELPSGSDPDGNSIGFFTFNDPSSVVAVDTSVSPPAEVPGSNPGNTVLQVDTNVVSGGWAGMVHAFENLNVDMWMAQNWSAYEGFSFWLYGNNTGSILFIDILDNRNPGSTTDDAERYSYDIVDDFLGWQFFEIPFTEFTRKEVGNNAPNDGFTLTQVHGWAFGVFSSGMPLTNYMDDVSVYGVAEVPELLVTFDANEYEVTEGGTAEVTVKLTRELGVLASDPAQVSVDFTSEPGSAVPGRDYTPVSGTFTFVQGGPSKQTFSVPTFDDPKHDGEKIVILRLTNPVDIPLGFVSQSVVSILDDDPLDPTLLDDFERGAYLWDGSEVGLTTPEITADDPLALPGQGAFEHILQVDTSLLVDIVISGNICKNGNGVIPVALLTTDSFDALTVDHSTVRFGNAAESHTKKNSDEVIRHEEDFEGDGDIDLIFHFLASETGYDCDSPQLTLSGSTFDGQPIIVDGDASFGRDFPIGQDWTNAEALSFWFYGTGSGDAITVQIKDNRAPDPGASGWNLVWSDEFSDPAGTPPNPANWSYEIGDGAANGIPGWGNSELQYYTHSPENSATDGNGNLVITAAEADGSLACYYGPCEYTSARLLSQYKAEFAYGRIESRIRVPQGAGLWPAFWSLGTDIGEVDWPQTGEIDFMEFVGRLPNEIFGTIHGPGYSGGQSFGGIYDFGVPVFEEFHTFAIEWEPDLITWYVDDILYHTATPADVAPNEWVFNDPVFLLLNVAVGGNFGGPVGEDVIFPQEMLIDYVRVWQAPDTAERWETTFADNFTGWQQVVIPFSSLTRSANQPDGAPDDGLNLNEVWGYGFELPDGGTTNGILLHDQVRLELIPPPTEIIVTNLNDSGSGSLRQALADIAIGGTITFDPGLVGGTIALSSGPLVPGHSVTVDASDAPGLSLDGGGTDRVLIIDPGLEVNLANINVTNGYGWQLAGGILNNGDLTLDHVTVMDNTMATDAGDFWQGGGGIYNGEGAALLLVDSTVTNNTAGWSGGGVYSFFNTNTLIVRSTISGNISNDVGGGLRLLGNADIVNSTISGNEATGWYGGALFITDGTVEITNTTITSNISPVWAPEAVFVGTFTDSSAYLNLSNSIIAANQTGGCFLAPFGSGAVAINSLGHNLSTDGTCNLTSAGDQVVGDAGLGPLADNGGPTWTHALLAGSPAIDAADAAACPATDQRGVPRPQGANCDIGAFEAE